MKQPENQPKNYDQLFNDIDKGIIKIPQFQRDFVWSKEETAKLLDSIIKGFPIGTFIFWKTKEILKHIRNIGNIELPSVPKGDFVNYVLDGQQRITSLYAVRKGIRITREGRIIDYKDICINLDIDLNSEDEIVLTDIPEETTNISIYNLLSFGMAQIADKYDKKYYDKIDNFKRNLTTYSFSTILINEYPIEIACEVFTRINTSGKVLALFEIMVAMTFDLEKKFDLYEKFQILLKGNGKEKCLEEAGFETIPTATVLQCVSAIICQQVRRQDILKLGKRKFIDNWEITTKGIFAAIDYIRTHLRVKVSKLLPYNAIIVPLSYFFIKNKFKKPTNYQNKLLTQYYFWCAFGNRFTSGVESKIALDIKKMHKILNEVAPSYKGEEVILTLEELKEKKFSTGDAFCLGIISMLCYFEPKSFSTNSAVTLDNSWLINSSSKNYHHFFPKSYLKKKGYEDYDANLVLNITLVDEYLNKREIKAKAPSLYMRKFKRENSSLKKTMKTHLIDDLDSFGIWDNNYEIFIEKRGNRILDEINIRLNPKIN